ncbi:hypothetical protein [Candidatus Thiosymbion oneisti]|uniref:hypothetical protein n=1 Tax=Candidatus Thiosymbion oneisti TaxID=589554 RepID=UPI00114CA260|nr:hypothetical protein [Candidatus Thiosymbion oneisti]
MIISTEGYYSYVKNGLFEKIHGSKKFMIRAIAEEIYRNEGKKEGEEKGRREEKIEMAKVMKQEKVSITIIAKASGLSIEEIKKL